MLARADGLVLLVMAFATAPVLWKKSRRLPVLPILFCLLAMAATIRLDMLHQMKDRPLDPDAAGFLQIARSMTWFYDTETREPLFLLPVKLVAWTGDAEFHLRLLTLVLSMVLVGVAGSDSGISVPAGRR